MDFWIIAVELFGNLIGLVMNCFQSSPSRHDSGDEGQNSRASSSFSPPLEVNLSTAPPPTRTSSSSNPLSKQQHEVFLSFRGETRRGFTDHLYRGLKNVGIFVFRDREELPVGERNWPELVKAIETSKVSIPIISPNYASSKWCLNELVYILKCKKTFGQIVIPVFYQVKPSDVRKKSDALEEESDVCKKRRHDDDGTHVQEWKDALMEVSYMTGLESERIVDGYEGELIEILVTKVIRALNKHALIVSDDLVGVEDCVKEIKNMVNVEGSSEVHAILIYGMGGIGKTTLAMVAYNQLAHQLDCCSFLANVRERWSQYNGVRALQKQLISDILGKEQSDNVCSTNKGLEVIRDRFKYKKVLIVLDDVDNGDQLDALVGNQNWFGRESVVIITSRKANVLKEWEGSLSYELKSLNDSQSFQLFCKYAFKNNHLIPSELHTIAKEIVSTTGGLPLALKVIGRRLCNEDGETWKDVLKKLKETPDDDVQSKLMISFDALEYEEKQIFLDISCLPIHKNMELALHLWDGRNFCSKLAIKKLVAMSLIKIGERKELIIHDQLRDLGREIVRKEDTEEPGMRSRLWKTEEAWKILELEQGTPKVRALNLDLDHGDGLVRLTSKQFKNMKNLRFLRMRNIRLEGDFEKLFLNLRWFESINFLYSKHTDIMDINFLPKQLAILTLGQDTITEHWNGWSQMKNLKVLRLCECHRLTTTPDFSVMKELEILELIYCRALEKIHPSIGKLNKTLKVLDVQGCHKLKELPKEVGKMEELRELNINWTGIRGIPILEGYLTKLETIVAQYCRQLKYIPDSIGSLVNLQHLLLNYGRSLTKIPESIGKLKSLSKLNLTKTGVTLLPDSIGDLYDLKELHISRSSIKWSPTSIGKLSNLRSLEFSGDSVETLPDFSNLTNLNHLTYYDAFKRRNRMLNLGMLNQLETLNIYELYNDVLDSKEGIDMASKNVNLQLELPSRLQKLKVKGCQILRILPNFSTLKNLSELCVDGCSELVEINGLEGAESLTLLEIKDCRKFSRLCSMGNMITKLDLYFLDTLESLPDLSVATKLKDLRIVNCKSLVQIQGLGSITVGLQYVEICGCFSLERIDGLEELTSLTVLILKGCMSIRYLPDLSKLTNLKSLTVWNCEKLTEIRGLEKLRSLKYLKVTNQLYGDSIRLLDGEDREIMPDPS